MKLRYLTRMLHRSVFRRNASRRGSPPEAIVRRIADRHETTRRERRRAGVSAAPRRTGASRKTLRCNVSRERGSSLEAIVHRARREAYRGIGHERCEDMANHRDVPVEPSRKRDSSSEAIVRRTRVAKNIEAIGRIRHEGAASCRDVSPERLFVETPSDRRRFSGGSAA